mgnify:CR=1 FL=1
MLVNWAIADSMVSEIPDFSRYAPMRTLEAKEFPLGQLNCPRSPYRWLIFSVDDPNRRVILVGDIHGMYKPFRCDVRSPLAITCGLMRECSALLQKVNYQPDADVLIHTGDFLSKGMHHHSLEVLEFMTLHNITGVRGNHDQQVLEWKGWINWITSSPDGREWLKRTEHNWRRAHGHKGKDLDDFLDQAMQDASRKDKEWWKLIPAGWKFLSDHYRIAREMNERHYRYLLSLPAALHVPSAHTFVVHAGLLPSDPKYPYFETPRQPLAHVPQISAKACSSKNGAHCVEVLRTKQEKAILAQVPQNQDPWVLMNMRSVTKKGEVSRKYAGVYWTTLWNQQMKLCVGYSQGLGMEKMNEEGAMKRKKKHDLPCYPSTVVYGHSAAQGFHLKRWSIGLDSGCVGLIQVARGADLIQLSAQVYGRSLTAMVLGGGKPMHLEVQEPALEDDHIDLIEDINDDENEFTAGGDDSDREDEDNRENAESEEKRRKRRKKGGSNIRFGDRHRGKIVSVKCH